MAQNRNVTGLHPAWQAVFSRTGNAPLPGTPQPAEGNIARRQATLTEGQNNTPWGDDLLLEPDPEIYRGLAINPNGLRAKDDFADFEFVCGALKRARIDGISLPETNVNWRQYWAKHRCTDIARKFFGHARMSMSSSIIPFEKVFQPGGTATIIAGKFSSKVYEYGSDSSGLGRWSYALMRGKDGKDFVHMTIYQVCTNSIEKSGPRTAFTQ